MSPQPTQAGHPVSLPTLHCGFGSSAPAQVTDARPSGSPRSPVRHRSPVEDAPRHSTQEECALRSLGARSPRYRAHADSASGCAGSPPRPPARRPARTAAAWTYRTRTLGRGRGTRGRGPRPGPAHEARRSADTRLQQMPWSREVRQAPSPCRQGRVRTGSERTDGEQERARVPERTSLVHARGPSDGVHGARGVRDERRHFRRVDPPLRSGTHAGATQCRRPTAPSHRAKSALRGLLIPAPARRRSCSTRCSLVSRRAPTEIRSRSMSLRTALPHDHERATRRVATNFPRAGGATRPP